MSEHAKIAERALTLENGEKVVLAFKAFYFPTSTSMRQKIKLIDPRTEHEQIEKRSDRNLKDGLIALTNRRIFWLEERGTFKKSYYPSFSINLRDITGMNLQGTMAKRININTSHGEFQFRFGNMENFINWVTKYKSQAEAPLISGTSKDSSFDNLKKLKELLDIGAITKEEYEEKKRGILEKI